MKSFPARLLASIVGYRLGYSPKRPYPWPWTTLVGFGILFTSIGLLVCVNIPLSAYEVVQELTYFPNATLPALLLGNLVPSFLQESPGSFAPQTWSVGYTFRLNNSGLQFTVASASDPLDNMTPVNSFSYSNVAFSENCDVASVTITLSRAIHEESSDYQYYLSDASASITCNLPTRVGLTASLPTLGYGLSLGGPILDQVNDYALDLHAAFYADVFKTAGGQPGTATIRITARPCCNCSTENSADFLAEEGRQLLQPPCSSTPSRFVVTSGNVQNTASSNAPWGVPYTPTGDNNTDLFDGLGATWRDGYIGSGDLSILDDPFRNMFQVYYHLLRRDMGVLLDNQIYGSPDMYNRSIILIDPGDGMAGTPFGTIGKSAAARYHALLANETIMEQWRDMIQVFNETDRVPVLEYLRPIPRRKQLGSAITSVFAATFAMVATVWKLFSLIAGCLVRSPRNRDRTSNDQGEETDEESLLAADKTAGPDRF